MIRGEDAVTNLQVPFDIIVASDVIAPCYSDVFPKFFATLGYHSSPDTLILLSYEKRDMRDVEFFKQLRENFSFQKVSCVLNIHSSVAQHKIR